MDNNNINVNIIDNNINLDENNIEEFNNDNNNIITINNNNDNNGNHNNYNIDILIIKFLFLIIRVVIFWKKNYHRGRGVIFNSILIIISKKIKNSSLNKQNILIDLYSNLIKYLNI